MSLDHLTEEAHLDGPILSELQDIMEDDFGILIETYIDDAEQKLQAMEESVATGDAGAIRELSHSLKGASCNIGALPLSRLFERVEHLAKEQDLTDVPGLLPGIGTEFSAVKQLLQAKLN